GVGALGAADVERLAVRAEHHAGDLGVAGELRQDGEGERSPVVELRRGAQGTVGAGEGDVVVGVTVLRGDGLRAETLDRVPRDVDAEVRADQRTARTGEAAVEDELGEAGQGSGIPLL